MQGGSGVKAEKYDFEEHTCGYDWMHKTPIVFLVCVNDNWVIKSRKSRLLSYEDYTGKYKQEDQPVPLTTCAASSF